MDSKRQNCFINMNLKVASSPLLFFANMSSTIELPELGADWPLGSSPSIGGSGGISDWLLP